MHKCVPYVVEYDILYMYIRSMELYNSKTLTFDPTDTANQIVRRRFKEFVGLDAKLRQFHGDMPHTLPSKRAFRNLDKSVVETRCKELELYLQNLIGLPGVRESQILSTFLSNSSDPSLFLPETVGNKAGKMIKSVPGRLKREVSSFVV